MNGKALLNASATTLMMLVLWWAGILYLDGALAQMLPYDQYEMVALLYPEVYYPALPGWILAHAQPFSIGVWLVAIGWMVALSMAIGAAATRYATELHLSPVTAAAAFVALLFVAVTILEAAVALRV